MRLHRAAIVVGAMFVATSGSASGPAAPAGKGPELCVHRHEDAGAMNAAVVRIFVKAGKTEPQRQVATLTGGQQACAPVKPGPLHVEASGRWPYETDERGPRVCKSNVLTVTMEPKQRLDVWVSPKGDPSAYSCGWILSTTEPPK